MIQNVGILRKRSLKSHSYIEGEKVECCEENSRSALETVSAKF